MKTLDDYERMLLDAGYILYVPKDEYESLKEADIGWFYYTDSEKKAFVYFQSEPVILFDACFKERRPSNIKWEQIVYEEPIELKLEDFQKVLDKVKKLYFIVTSEEEFYNARKESDGVIYESMRR